MAEPAQEPAASTAPSDPQAKQVGRALGHSLSGVLCALVVATLLANAAAAFFVVPRFVTIFEDFDTELPTLTTALIESRGWIVVISLLLSVLMVTKEVFIRPPVAKLIINALVFGAALVLVPITIFGLFLPMVKLMQSAP